MIWAMDEKGYRLTRKLADEEHALITTHVAETTFEIETTASRYGMNDTEFLSEIGFLGPDVLAAHCVHCKEDIRILRNHDDESVAQSLQQYVSGFGMRADPRDDRGRCYGGICFRRPGKQQQS